MVTPEKSSGKKEIEKNASKELKRLRGHAEDCAKDPRKIRKLLEDALKKIPGVDRGPFKEMWAYLMAMLRLLKAYCKGEYRDIAWPSLVSIILGVLYFVSPIDLIPDFLPGGWLDDALVLALVLKSVKGDLDDFLEWETRRS